MTTPPAPAKLVGPQIAQTSLQNQDNLPYSSQKTLIPHNTDSLPAIQTTFEGNLQPGSIPENYETTETPQDKFSSTPDDPWHLTFTELRAMRVRMLTLERLETATNNFTSQMQSVCTRTTNLESVTGHTSNQMAEVREEVAALKKSVQDSAPEKLVEMKGEISALKKIVQNSKIDQTSNQLKKVQEEVSALKKTVQQQQVIISDLKQAKEELIKTKEDFNKTTKKTISDMHKLADQQKTQVDSFKATKEDLLKSTQKTMSDMHKVAEEQKTQVDSFKSCTKNLKRDIKKDTEEQIIEVKKDVNYTVLKGQAFQNRFNLVITGLPEHTNTSAYATAMKFFKTQLKLNKINVTSAHRIGPTPSEDSKYARPIVVTFASFGDKSSVWKTRKDIPYPPRDEGNHNSDPQQQPTTEGQDTQTSASHADTQQRVTIQADLPKQLREDVNILFKVAKAAEKIPEFETVSIKDYALHLLGKTYSARHLERLPYSIRPSTLATRKTDSVLAFFTKSCPLSNHYPSMFKVDGTVFYNVEQYLAFKKAELAQRNHLVRKALGTQDPVEAKSILHTLRDNNVEEWQRRRAEVATEAIRAKFAQNKVLRDYLCNTRDRRLGEASKTPVGEWA